MKISYSQCSTFKQCPMHWHNKYKKKYDPIEQGASLFFGSAVDDAIMAMLENKGDALEIFNTMWKISTNMFGKVTPIFDNPDVVYSHADFDKYVLHDEDKQLLADWIKELKVERNTIDEKNFGDVEEGEEVTQRLETVDEVYSRIANVKKNPYKKLKKGDLTYFSRASWLSLKRKGEILITSFEEQFLPVITKVHGTQLRAEIKSDDGEDAIGGLLDFVAEIKGYDKPIIIDLKTAARPYTQEQIDRTEQLALYYALKGEEYNTNLVGYVILCKNIPKIKEAFCTSCGHERTGRHKTCDNIVETTVDGEVTEKRCNGSWDEKVKLAPEVQVLVQEKGQKDKDDLYQDYSNILYSMKKEIVYKNTDKCNQWFGGKCPYYGLCHENNTEGLRQRGNYKK